MKFSRTQSSIVLSILIILIIFIKSFEIEIESIKYIEAITVKKVGVVYITIKSDPEDFYYLHLKDKSKIKIDSYYRNSRKSMGRYLSKKYRIQFKETEKVKYFH